MENRKTDNVRIHYDVQLEPELFDLLLANSIPHSFAFSSDQYIPFDENETIFLQIGNEWFDARITKIKKGVEFGKPDTVEKPGGQSARLTILIDAVLLERERVMEYVRGYKG